MQILILAAGKGSRMGNLTNSTHKSLLKINDSESFLTQLLNQLQEYPIDNIFIVTGYKSDQIESAIKNYQIKISTIFNKKYDVDTNIYSMKLALDKVNLNKSLLIIEADTYVDDYALKNIMDATKKNESFFFTRGYFEESMIGGIVLPNKDNIIEDIKIVKKYSNKFKNYYKMLGIQTISSKYLKLYKSLLNQYIKVNGLNNYFHFPIIDNFNKFKFKFYDLKDSIVESVNTVEDYNKFLQKIKNESNKYSIELLELSYLKPIEDYSNLRFEYLFEKINKEKVWNKPLVVDKDFYLILDGHHRFEVAKKMKLNKVPIIKLNYKNIKIWSLRDDEIVNHELVIEKSLKGNIYPRKTVKHNFTFPIPNCNFNLNDLKK